MMYIAFRFFIYENIKDILVSVTFSPYKVEEYKYINIFFFVV